MATVLFVDYHFAVSNQTDNVLFCKALSPEDGDSSLDYNYPIIAVCQMVSNYTLLMPFIWKSLTFNALLVEIAFGLIICPPAKSASFSASRVGHSSF